MFTWASVILSVIKLIGSVIDSLNKRQIITDTEQRLLAGALLDQAKLLEAANEAREKQRRDNAAVPATDSLPDDGFRRD